VVEPHPLPQFSCMVVDLEPLVIGSQYEAHVRKNRGFEHEVRPDEVPLKDAGLGFFVVLSNVNDR